MTTLGERKIDCHCHILDPRTYPYRAGVAYRPEGQEIGTEVQFLAVCDAYNVDHALLVGPNSGYGDDNSCMLGAISRGQGQFKGIAVVTKETPSETLAHLKAQGIAGIAINATYHGVEFYLDWGPLVRRLAALDMFLQIQVEGSQLIDLLPLAGSSNVRLLFDHCGRPDIGQGLSQPGFSALCELGRSGRAAVKLSGLQKFSRERFPYLDAFPYVDALVESFGPDNCLWGSDWPFLRAPERLDYGPLLTLASRLFPDAKARRKVLWDNPRRLFGFEGTSS
jgi:predicted TIM-barrel fold metal-dependent hydrolase